MLGGRVCLVRASNDDTEELKLKKRETVRS